jgi:hypothetical protein
MLCEEGIDACTLLQAVPFVHRLLTPQPASERVPETRFEVVPASIASLGCASGACGGLGVSWRDHFAAGFLDREFDPDDVEGSPSCSKMGKDRLLFDIAAPVGVWNTGSSIHFPFSIPSPGNGSD